MGPELSFVHHMSLLKHLHLCSVGKRFELCIFAVLGIGQSEGVMHLCSVGER